MQPFDLERFKAGEPAYYVKVEITECFYFGELPDGKIVVRCQYKNDTQWYTRSYSLDYVNNNFYMKERKLTWDDFYEMCGNRDSQTHIRLNKWLEENFEPPKLKKK
jgi:hypothetical protein